MTRTRAALAPLVILLAASLAAASAHSYDRGRVPRAYFGAIAVKQGTATYGYAYDFPTSRAAQIEALRQCADDACEVLVDFRNGCAAAARSREGGRVIAVEGATRAEAEAKAVRKCGPDCEALTWACTR